MTFDRPFFLLLFLCLPVVIFIGWPSRSLQRRRELTSLPIRLLFITLLILSLAGLSLSRKSSRLSVAFLLDQSDSIRPAARAASEQYIRQALTALGADDQAAVIVFGGDALVERPMSGSTELAAIRSTPLSSQTDLSKAIQLALASFLPNSTRRLVILTDGAINAGDTEEALRLAAEAGIELLILPLETTLEHEVLIDGLEIPQTLHQEERFNLEIALNASQPTSAEIRVLAQDQLIYSGTHALRRGAQTLSLPLLAGEPGFTRYKVQVIPDQDTYYQNNELSTFTQIEGPPKILLVAPPEGERIGITGEARPDEYRPLAAALGAAGLDVDVIRPEQLPVQLYELADYASIILVDVPARKLNPAQLSGLQAYVSDLGGGLVAIGGPTSYGLGGYYRTPLETILPLDMQIRDNERRPSLAIVFVIDHSGSMSDASGGVPKLELAKEAAIRSAELLASTDQIGVVAFDDSASWVVPLTEMDDPQTVQRAIATIRSGGGTDILAGLQAVAEELPDVPALNKHIILLTDGGADPSGIPELVEQMHREHGITLTTVGIGRDAAPFLPGLAEIGGGRYHFTPDPSAIPSIFTEETSLATRAYLVEEAFIPQFTAATSFLNNIPSMPTLFGYVGTSPKDTAQVYLVAPNGDPLLASWQYGLGKVVAFTSDASGRWAKEWLRWDGFPQFWSQAVGYTTADQTPSPLEIQVELPRQGDAQIIVDAVIREADGTRLINGYALEANLIFPSGKSSLLELSQEAPGRYRGSFTPDEEGAYLIHVTGVPDPAVSAAEAPFSELSATSGWTLSYSPEYQNLTTDASALLRLSAIYGGQAAPAEAEQVFTRSNTTLKQTSPLWPVLLTLSVLLLPLDIGIRRLALTTADLRRGFTVLSAYFAGFFHQPTRVSDEGNPITPLLERKHSSNHARGEAEADLDLTPPNTAAKPTLTPLPTQYDKEAETPASTDLPGTDPNQTASRLLAYKRSRKSRDDDPT